MKEILIYREGSIKDFEELYQLAFNSYKEFESQLTTENWAIMSSRLKDREALQQLVNKADVYVCCLGKDIVGAAYIVPRGNPAYVFESDWSYIRMVGVHPAYRGRNISRKLTQMCIAKARENNENLIALHTSEMMSAACHIYETLGFVKDRELDMLFGKKYWLYKMIL